MCERDSTDDVSGGVGTQFLVLGRNPGPGENVIIFEKRESVTVSILEVRAVRGGNTP